MDIKKSHLPLGSFVINTSLDLCHGRSVKTKSSLRYFLWVFQTEALLTLSPLPAQGEHLHCKRHSPACPSSSALEVLKTNAALCQWVQNYGKAIATAKWRVVYHMVAYTAVTAKLTLNKNALGSRVRRAFPCS